MFPASLQLVGPDHSEDRLVVAAGTTKPWTVAHTPDGIAGLVTRLAAMQPTLVVLEATGGYEQRAATALHDAGQRVAVINPRQLRDFAKGRLLAGFPAGRGRVAHGAAPSGRGWLCLSESR